MADRLLSFVNAVVELLGRPGADVRREDLIATAEWKNGDIFAGVQSDQEEGCSVYLIDAGVDVHTPGEAAAILARIFSDEVVAVGAYARGALVYVGLAPAEDPGAGFGQLDGISAGDMPHVDKVEVWRWSDGANEDQT